MKAKFIIVGSGWRSRYYARIAKALPEQFELCAMLCRTEEKAEKLQKEMGIHTTTSIEECENYKPDFVVVAVNKNAIYEVSKEWMAKGFTVLCETPAALNIEALQELWRLRCEKGYKLCVAEQYFKYPTYASLLSVLESNLIGEPYSVTLSLAHGYHGASLIKKALGITEEQVCLIGKSYTFPIVETASRYEQFTDGRIVNRKRECITFEFENSKVAFYDFCSEQYRSPIRKNYINVQGPRGELKDYEVYYLNKNNQPENGQLSVFERKVVMGDVNPNLNEIIEIEKIVFDEQDIYRPQFGLSGLAEDETAVASLMMGAANYHHGGMEIYPLKEALQDAYLAILMQEAIAHPGKKIQSEKQPWHTGGKLV